MDIKLLTPGTVDCLAFERLGSDFDAFARDRRSKTLALDFLCFLAYIGVHFDRCL